MQLCDAMRCAVIACLMLLEAAAHARRVVDAEPVTRAPTRALCAK
jgi:hypothetical protein